MVSIDAIVDWVKDLLVAEHAALVTELDPDRAKKAIVRPLFIVRRRGPIFQAVVGEEYRRPYGTAYAQALFISDEPKVIARYGNCTSCDATGKIDAKKCRDCGGAGWCVKLTGERIDFSRLAAPSEVRKVLAPDVKSADYDAD